MKQTGPIDSRPRDTLYDHADAVLANPAFDGALRAFCIGLADLHADPAFTNAGLAKTLRWAVAALLVHLDDIAPASVRAATLSRLCATGGLGTRNTVAAALAVFRKAGLVTEAPSAGDRRIHVFRPTAQLNAMIVNSFAVRLRSVAMVHALPLPPDGWAAEPGVFHRFLTGLVTAYVQDGFRPYGDCPEARSMVEHQSGYAFLLTLMAGALRYGDRVTVHVSLADTAARFAVSREHVGKLIGIGVSEGWLTQTGAAGRLMIAAPAHDRLRRWIATEIAWTAQLAGAWVAGEK